MLLELKDGFVTIELYPDIAPNHVKRFKLLASEKKYDGVVFHRVIDGFMAQTGDVKFGNSSSKDFDLRRAGMGGSDLPDLSQNTLKTQKSADGLVSLQWYREGKIDKIVEYCQKDVEITRDLFLYGESNGHVVYQTRSGTTQNVEVDWKTANLI